MVLANNQVNTEVQAANSSRDNIQASETPNGKALNWLSENNMSQEMVKLATCLCGEVRIKAHHVSRHVTACHCRMCRKWGGGPFMEVDCGTEVRFEGEQNIRVFDSSEWAERGFCSKCGSHLFYRLKDTNQYMIPVGLFDDTNHFTFDHQVFIDKKPSYYRFANRTKDMTAAEVFARYAPEQEEAGR